MTETSSGNNIRDLNFQIACLRDNLAASRTDDIRAGAEAGIKSLEWVQRYINTIKEVDRLRKEAPTVLAILETWPGAKIESIRGKVPVITQEELDGFGYPGAGGEGQ